MVCHVGKSLCDSVSYIVMLSEACGQKEKFIPGIYGYPNQKEMFSITEWMESSVADFPPSDWLFHLRGGTIFRTECDFCF